ncbi:MAG: hypothetical protein WC686_05300, partial [Candidatus Shapirobacteria bacterium]
MKIRASKIGSYAVIGLSLLALLAGILLAGQNQEFRRGAAGSGVRLFVLPSEKIVVGKGQQFKVQLWFDSGDKTDHVKATLCYGSNISLTGGQLSALAVSGAAMDEDLRLVAKTVLGKSCVEITEGATRTDDALTSGAQKYAEVNFEAREVGTGRIDYDLGGCQASGLVGGVPARLDINQVAGVDYEVKDGNVPTITPIPSGCSTQVPIYDITPTPINTDGLDLGTEEVKVYNSDGYEINSTGANDFVQVKAGDKLRIRSRINRTGIIFAARTNAFGARLDVAANRMELLPGDGAKAYAVPGNTPVSGTRQWDNRDGGYKELKGTVIMDDLQLPSTPGDLFLTVAVNSYDSADCKMLCSTDGNLRTNGNPGGTGNCTGGSWPTTGKRCGSTTDKATKSLALRLVKVDNERIVVPTPAGLGCSSLTVTRQNGSAMDTSGGVNMVTAGEQLKVSTSVSGYGLVFYARTKSFGQRIDLPENRTELRKCEGNQYYVVPENRVLGQGGVNGNITVPTEPGLYYIGLTTNVYESSDCRFMCTTDSKLRENWQPGRKGNCEIGTNVEWKPITGYCGNANCTKSIAIKVDAQGGVKATPTVVGNKVTAVPTKSQASSGTCAGQYWGKSQCDSRADKSEPGSCQLNPALGQINASNPSDPVN